MIADRNWPSYADYQLAVQDCRYSFNDPELRQGNAEKDEWQIPRPYSGNFAVVFCVRCKVGGQRKAYAVRCFTRQVQDQQERYEKLSRHLQRHKPRGMVNFQYLEQGIRVNGDWFPIVKMEWIRGLTLDQAVEQAITKGDLERLEKWAQNWKSLLNSLCQARIGHGDLQHGNILIAPTGSDLKLVDYDGIYIPDLDGKPPQEVGHPNYQHPQRLRDGYYKENVDSFSALVIYLSLLALRHDRTLWPEFHRDDALIFVREDFLRPGQTEIWRRLLDGPEEVCRLAERLWQCCVSHPADLPSPDKILELDGVAVNVPYQVLPTPGSDWWEDYLALPGTAMNNGTWTGRSMPSSAVPSAPGSGLPGLSNPAAPGPSNPSHSTPALQAGQPNPTTQPSAGSYSRPQPSPAAPVNQQSQPSGRMPSHSTQSHRQQLTKPQRRQTRPVRLVIILAIILAIIRWLLKMLGF